MVVAANLAKGGGLLLLSSCCTRTSSPLLSTCYYSYSRLKRNSGGLPFSTSISISISISISSLNDGNKRRTTTAAVSRLFCSSSSKSNVEEDDSSSAVLTANEDVADDDMRKIKDAANTLDLRVGKILRAWRHEEADSLYVEEVDVGEPQSRIICSGLVNYMPLHHLQDKKVVVLANLKPRNMRGVKSNGMLMAASDASHENVELLVPPEGTLPGERIWFGSAEEKDNLPDAASPNQIQKKKIWELVQPYLRTDASCVASLGMHFMRTAAGVVVCRSLKNANIS